MAARIPKKPETTDEQPSEQSIETPEPSDTSEEPRTEPPATESDPKSRRRLPPKRVLIPIIAAVTAIVLGVGGWLIYSSIQRAQAKDAYETSLSELSAAQDAANTANADLSAAAATLAAHVDIAEQLLALLGEDGDILQAAAAATVDAKAVLGAALPTVPARTAGELSESPTVEEYDALRVKVDEMLASVKADTKLLNERREALSISNIELTDAWTAQTVTVPDAVEAALAANTNASQDTKDAVTAAGEALSALVGPLGAESPELWQAFQSAFSTLESEEQDYQEQKAAEEEAARQRARNNSGGSGGGSGSGGGGGGGGHYIDETCQSPSCYTGPSAEELGEIYRQQLLEGLAAEWGVSVSDVTCEDGVPYPSSDTSDPWYGKLGTMCSYWGGGRWFGTA